MDDIDAMRRELRRDVPNVHGRVDAEAEALTQSVDPHDVLETLEARLENIQETAAATQIVAEEMDSAVTEMEQTVQHVREEPNVESLRS